jgi:DNA-binding XRE family transcriptional regulator
MGTAVSAGNSTCNSSIFLVVFDSGAGRNVTWSVGTRPRGSRTFAPSAVARPRDLGRLIANLRATAGGEDAWLRAQERKEEARREAMALGKISCIKYQRIQRGMTQLELAAAMGSRQSDVSRYERLGYHASRRTLEKVAHVLGVPIADLI